MALSQSEYYIDVTNIVLGGKSREGNVYGEYLLRKFRTNSGPEESIIKNQFIKELIQYNKFTSNN